MSSPKANKTAPVGERLAVCTWSLQPAGPRDLIEKLRATGLARAQVALDPWREAPEIWGGAETVLRENGVAMVSGMVGCVGEDYATLESIRLTGGVAPDGTWEENLRNFGAAAALARRLGLKLVTFHAGFVPAEETDPGWGKMRRRLAAAADVFGAQGIAVGLETGQETAGELAALLGELDHPNLGVNFDPANMILYDKGDPIEAVRVLAPWIRQVHVKDAKRTKVPGTWGEEVAVGEGDVDWGGFFAAVRVLPAAVDLAIEREAGSRRVADVGAARMVAERLFY